MTPQQYANLRDAAKKVAAKSLLGIEPEDFDDMDPSHLEAQRFAMGQIQSRAREIAAERASQAAYAEQLAGEIRNLEAEYSKDQEFFQNHEALMHDWLNRQPYKTANAAIQAVRVGDAAGIRKFMSSVYAEYKAGKAPRGQVPAKAQTPPPPVMKAASGDGAEHSAGMADVSNLGDMDPDEQAEWLIKNKFV
jgi:hypothetical protein